MLLEALFNAGIAAVPSPSPTDDASERTCGIAAAAAEVHRSAAPGADRLLDCC